MIFSPPFLNVYFSADLTICNENERRNDWYEEKTHMLYNKLVEHDCLILLKKAFASLVFVLRWKTCENLCIRMQNMQQQKWEKNF